MDSFEGIKADPLSLHKYLYANANPISFADPSGQMSLAELGEAVQIWGQNLVNYLKYAGPGDSAAKVIRVAVGVSVIVGESAYILLNSPGLAAIRTTTGKIRGGSWFSSPQGPSEFDQILNEEDANSVVSVVITGHASGTAIELRWDYTDMRELAPKLARVMAPGGVVTLNGCGSADAAEEGSKRIPGVRFVGYKRIILGGAGIGINACLMDLLLSRVEYINGKEVD